MDNLDTITTRAELAEKLRSVHIRADRPSLRALEAKTRHDNTPLSKTVISEMLKGIRLPRKAVMLAFLRACQVESEDLESWSRTWERIASIEQKSARTGTKTNGLSSGNLTPNDMPFSGQEMGEPKTAGLAQSAETEVLTDESEANRGDVASGSDARSAITFRRELGARLRELRENKGLMAEQAAEHLMCSLAKIRRIEIGFVSARERDIRDLCAFYGVVDGVVQNDLIELAHRGKEQDSWQFYDVSPSGFNGLEAEATVLKKHHSSIIPGLLQTADYARSVVASYMTSLSREMIQHHIAEIVDQRVEERLVRQRLLTKERPPHLWSILDEAALRRLVGNPQVMKVQLERLIDVARMPNISIRVIPYSAGIHPAIDNNFTILEFIKPSDKLVYWEGLIGVTYFDDRQEVDRYIQIFSSLQAIALDEMESMSLVAKACKDIKDKYM